MTARTNGPSGTKDAWRRRVLAARRALSPQALAARDAALVAGAVAAALSVDGPVCAYLPVGTEPGGAGLVDALAAAGIEVLLPVVPREAPVPPAAGPLDWARHDGVLRDGPLGLREPAGTRLGPAAVAEASLVLVPALAVDRTGTRLGRGGGFYDRTLPLATGRVVALVGEGELVDEALPAEAHDRPVDAALLPAGLVTLGKPG